MSATFPHYNNIFTRWHRWAINYTLVCTPPEWVHSVHQCSFFHRKSTVWLYWLAQFCSLSCFSFRRFPDDRVRVSGHLPCTLSDMQPTWMHISYPIAQKILSAPFWWISDATHWALLGIKAQVAGNQLSGSNNLDWLAAHIFDNITVDKIAKHTWLYSGVARQILVFNWSVWLFGFVPNDVKARGGS